MSMFHKNLASSSDRNREFGTPGIIPATPSMTPGGPSTPGLTSSVMSPAPVTPSYTGPSSTPGMTPREPPPGFLTSADGVGGVAEVHEDEEPEEESREGQEEADIIKQLTTLNPFTPAAGSAYARIPSWVDSSFPSVVSGTPQVSTPRQDRAEGSTAGVTPAVSGVTDRVSEMTMLQHKYGATKPVIHNVVATASLGCVLDLKQIAMTARNAEYNPRRFAAVVMRIREPKSTALVFKSGKLVVTGTKSQEEARHAARKFGRVIMKVGYTSARFRDFHVENLVSTFNVPFPIHLERLYKSLPNTMHSQYEPEVFPGLICRVPGGTLLIFVSGRVVMIGMKTEEDIFKAYKYILPKLEEHRKK